MNLVTDDHGPNRLIREKSPYLLQHAYNPVDWYPWGVEAFEKAELEDKPIFLSIGYASCHWCHVMENESFENQEVADLLNETFICIKVDREQRPDIDRTYMRVCQLMTGSGGWPLTLLLTPKRKPFYAATYIPRISRFGRTGMIELIPRIKELWMTKRDEIEHSADQIISHLQRGSETIEIVQDDELETSTLDEAFVYFVDHYDSIYGGFDKAPKFPSPHRLSFLLRYWKRTRRKQALHMVENTLEAMQRGGIYDHIGFGFHRYSTDRQWLVPHFEKMLYDQAMLTITYLETYQATGKKEFKETAQATLTYVLRDLTDPDGGFYSAEDADVEGNEGEFYLWTENDIRNLIPNADADLIMSVFNIRNDGNFEEESTQEKTGANILHLTKSLQEISSRRQIPLEILKTRWEMTRQILFAARETRLHPGKDDKILTDWNGLMIAALAKATQILKDAKYVNAAKNAVAFILEKMRDSKGRLYHSYRDGEAAVSGFLDDYAFLIWGLIEVYQTTFEVEYLRVALSLNQQLLTHFWDDKQGGFYFTADDTEQILIRHKEAYDSAYPSGNAVAALNLLRLTRITAKPEFEAKTQQLIQTFSPLISQIPASYTSILMALDFALGPSYEVVIVGDLKYQDTENMLDALNRFFIPNKIVLFRPVTEEYPEIGRVAEFTEKLTSLENRATAYVCRNYQCDLPTTSTEKMLKLLNATT
jgi:uncharacterized protein YyaL (SSP411 family)